MVTPFGAPGRVPFLPRSSIPVDTTNHLDARLTKMFFIKESMNVALSFEAFNVFNIISNTSVVQNAYFATGNVIKAGAGVGTGTASADSRMAPTRDAPRSRRALRSKRGPTWSDCRSREIPVSAIRTKTIRPGPCNRSRGTKLSSTGQSPCSPGTTRIWSDKTKDVWALPPTEIVLPGAQITAPVSSRMVNGMVAVGPEMGHPDVVKLLLEAAHVRLYRQ